MKLKLKITRHTTKSELIHLGMFFTSLGLNAGAKVVAFTPPTDPAELDEPEVVHVAASPEQEASIDKAVGNEPPKRRRRTKAEIEAEHVVQAGGPFYWWHPESDSAGSVATRVELDKLLIGDPLVCEVSTEQYEAIVADIAERKNAPIKAEVGNVQPAATQAATVTDGVEKEAAASEPATESPSDGKTYTAAEVQQQATVVARTHGADLVKAKIAELGGARIADLNAEQVNTLGAYLFSVK